jgi:hypothetical protein
LKPEVGFEYKKKTTITIIAIKPLYRLKLQEKIKWQM